MKAFLIETLETLGFPVFQQGSMSDGEPYPPSFITFLLIDSEDAANFDNVTRAIAYTFQVAFYSSDPLLVESVPKLIRSTVKAAGGIMSGVGRDIPSDEPTHTGNVQECTIIEKIKEA